ncbi:MULTISPECIES: rhodanese-like domain-containing protein [unclassified Pseudofrankia]|uniref:rhodanese-like domain-containing protein n=1 Tax=unclassified Pseudofrankia TaxID=2994372 RepID=UPI0008D90DA1|nr:MULTISPECIES: rhodanese-like domain-containing protein [unclassified Pseudofrankia]MDT3445050.1 rhodanese-like domain-containing protein [Pseudofrankia sp. BMG5.37]OHV47190.1 ketopantoate reductase [Pseudofrankia sp. BMG5.36]
MSSRYVIIGAGAVGASVAAQLTEAGIPVVVVARGANLTALREHGLRYLRPDGERRVAFDVAAGPDEVRLRAGDVLVLATKSQDAEALLATWAWQPVDGAEPGPGAAPGEAAVAAEVLPVVLPQNGIDSVRSALRRFTTVIDTVVIIPAIHLRPGEVVSPGTPQVGGFVIGRAPRGGGPASTLAGDRAAEQVAADLRRAGFATTVVDDIGRYKAGKLLSNLAYNLDAAVGPGPLRDAAVAAVVDEARAAFAAAGIEPAEPITAPGLDLTGWSIKEISGYERSGSSTWQSLARGASVESDYLNGEIVLLARLNGIEAPVNAALARWIAAAARRGAAPSSFGEAELAAVLTAAGRPLPFSAASSAASSAGGGGAAEGVPAPAAVLVDPKPLHDELLAADPPLLLDVRWALGDARGREHHRAGHLPGAVYVDLETELAAPAAVPGGRHPLPDAAALTAAARRWGLTAGRRVVVYDDNGGQSAARAWWLLRWAGVGDVRILDGALAAWRAADLPLEDGEVTPAPGDVLLRGGALPTVDAAGAARITVEGILLDARAGERYRGEHEPVDPRAGHIPGARCAPTAANLDENGRFLPPDELRARFGALGAGEGNGVVGVYCGSGVTAAHEIAALAVAGIDAVLYPGSWSDWSSDSDRPVATGAG